MFRKAIFIIVICLPFSGFSQLFNAGLNTGFVMSQVDGDGYGGYNKLGLTFATTVSIKLKNKISLGTEIRYTQKGSADGMNLKINDFSTYKLRFSYMEIPLLLKYHFKDKLNFDTGFSISYLIKSTENINKNGAIVVTDKFNKFEIPFIFSAYYVISDKLDIAFRYSYSIFPIKLYSAPIYWYDRGLNNNLLSLSVNYKL